jgi:hypothetical protein
MATALDTVISFQSNVASVLPRYLLEDQALIIPFLEAYYEWLGKPGNPLSAGANIPNYSNIDTTKAEFVQFFKNTFLTDFPDVIASSKTLLIKHILDFYKSKGTEKAFELFFRAIYNKPVEFYYPRNDLLRPSNGKWETVSSMKVHYSGETSDVFKLISKSIYGETSKTWARVNNIICYLVGTAKVAELFVEDIEGSGFQPNETIRCEVSPGIFIRVTISSAVNRVEIISGGHDFVPGETIEVPVSFSSKCLLNVKSVLGGVVSSIIVMTPGSNYAVGDKVVFDNTKTGGGGARAIVESVTVNGNISSIRIIDAGNGYFKSPNVTISSATGSGASVLANISGNGSVKELDIIGSGFDVNVASTGSVVSIGRDCFLKLFSGAVHTYSGYSNKDGFLNDKDRIQDSNFYQDYSYVLKAGVDGSHYTDIIKEVAHPAGFKMFGEFQDVTELNMTMNGWNIQDEPSSYTFYTVDYDAFVVGVGLLEDIINLFLKVEMWNGNSFNANNKIDVNKLAIQEIADIEDMVIGDVLDTAGYICDSPFVVDGYVHADEYDDSSSLAAIELEIKARDWWLLEEYVVDDAILNTTYRDPNVYREFYDFTILDFNELINDPYKRKEVEVAAYVLGEYDYIQPSTSSFSTMIANGETSKQIWIDSHYVVDSALNIEDEQFEVFSLFNDSSSFGTPYLNTKLLERMAGDVIDDPLSPKTRFSYMSTPEILSSDDSTRYFAAAGQYNIETKSFIWNQRQVVIPQLLGNYSTNQTNVGDFYESFAYIGRYSNLFKTNPKRFEQNNTNVIVTVDIS